MLCFICSTCFYPCPPPRTYTAARMVLMRTYQFILLIFSFRENPHPPIGPQSLVWSSWPSQRLTEPCVTQLSLPIVHRALCDPVNLPSASPASSAQLPALSLLQYPHCIMKPVPEHRIWNSHVSFPPLLWCPYHIFPVKQALWQDGLCFFISVFGTEQVPDKYLLDRIHK